MKRTLFYILLASAVVMSCSKEPVTTDSGFLAKILETNASTRTSLASDHLSVLWNENDKVVAFSNGDKLAFYSSTKGPLGYFTANGSAAFFSTHDSYGYGVYYCTDNSNNPVIPYEISDYSFSTISNLPMYARCLPSSASSNHREITFENICAVLKITIPASYSTMDNFKITAGTNEFIAGLYTYSPETGISLGSSPSSTIIINFNASSSEKTIYVAIKPGNYTLSFSGYNGTNELKTLRANPQEFTRNTIYPVSFAVSNQ